MKKEITIKKFKNLSVEESKIYNNENDYYFNLMITIEKEKYILLLNSIILKIKQVDVVIINSFKDNEKIVLGFKIANNPGDKILNEYYQIIEEWDNNYLMNKYIEFNFWDENKKYIKVKAKYTKELKDYLKKQLPQNNNGEIKFDIKTTLDFKILNENNQVIKYYDLEC